jgi:hypothetical protein
MCTCCGFVLNVNRLKFSGNFVSTAALFRDIAFGTHSVYMCSVHNKCRFFSQGSIIRGLYNRRVLYSELGTEFICISWTNVSR